MKTFSKFALAAALGLSAIGAHASDDGLNYLVATSPVKKMVAQSAPTLNSYHCDMISGGSVMETDDVQAYSNKEAVLIAAIQNLGVSDNGLEFQYDIGNPNAGGMKGFVPGITDIKCHLAK